MSNTFAYIQSCRQLSSRIAIALAEQEDIAQTLELFRRLAEVSRPNDKAKNVLAILTYLALQARWARERLHIRVERKGMKTLIDLHEMAGAKVGRPLGTFLFNVPFEEFSEDLVPKRRTVTHEQFFIKTSASLITIERKPAARSVRPPAPTKNASVRPPSKGDGASIKKIDDDWE